jgi:opacity protein-like surface antigen
VPVLRQLPAHVRSVRASPSNRAPYLLESVDVAIGTTHALNKANTGEVSNRCLLEQRSNEMFRRKLAVAWIVGIVSTALPAFAQSETPDKNEVSVQAFGSFVKSTTDNGIENKATDSGGVLGSYRYFFNANNGVEANYGYSLNTQSYSSTGGVLGVKSYSHEISAAYVFRMPMRKFTPFVLAGAGGLIFDPKDFVDASSQARAAFVYGGGADFNLSRRIFVRAEYRGFVYNSPTYELTALAGADRITHRAEPSRGFGFRF